MASLDYFQLLSIELIEHILLQFTRPSDLLSLALTKRALCSVIIPGFLEYCQLKFYINRCDVWEHLDKRPILCSRVRHLELWTPFRGLGDFYCNPGQLKTTIPRVVRSEDGSLDGPWQDMMPAFHEAYRALTKMCNLERIVFNNDVAKHIPLHDVFAFGLAVYDASWGSIENIALNIFIAEPIDLDFPPLLGRFSQMLSNSIWLSSLKTLHLNLSFGCGENYPSKEFDANLGKALSRMVNLTHLRLITTKLSTQPSDDMMTCWPKLEWFFLQRPPASKNYPQLTLRRFYPDFIRGHPRLHTLFVDDVTILPPSQMDNKDMSKLPTSALKSLGYLPRPHRVSLKHCLPLSVLRNLSHLTYRPGYKPIPGDSSLFDELESLESCILEQCTAWDHEKLVIEIAQSMSLGCKKLKKLWIQSPYLNSLRANDPVFSLFQSLPNLTHLLGLYDGKRQFPGHEGDELLKKLYTNFPKLRYIDCYRVSPYQCSVYVACVELRRNDILQQMEYEFLDWTPDSCDPHQWGGFNILI